MNLITIKSRLPIIAGGGVLGLGVVAVLVLWVIPLIAGGSLSAPRAAPTEKFVVKRDTLVVKVTESGNVKALVQYDVKSKVPGQPQIKYLVKEGQEITPENVRKGLEIAATIKNALDNGYDAPDVKEEKEVEAGNILAQLDRMDLVNKRNQQKLSVTNAENAYYQAQGNLVIQLKQNDSDIRAGQLNVKFAKMDLEKYLGARLAGKVLAQRQRITQSRPETARPDQAQPVRSAPRRSPRDDQNQEPAEAAPEVKTDFLALVNSAELGGEALQQRRAFESDISLSKEELTRAQNKLNSTIDLVNKGYVAHDEQVADGLALKQSQVGLERAETALDLFIRYTFVKDAEKFLSDYTEAESELDRIMVRTDSKELQAATDMKSKESAMLEERKQMNDLNQQITDCTIVPTTTGIVVYANTGDRFRGGSQNPIAEGQTVSEGRTIISLPNMTTMAVTVQVNESSINKVHQPAKDVPPQQALIKPQALRDEVLHGTVTKVATVPDSQASFLNPDLRVYTTEVVIEGEHPELKPGMSAEVQIIAETIKDALIVPGTAVYVHGEDTVCYVIKDDRYECRPVLVGSSNDSFVEIKEGLREGETVLLREPRTNEERVEYVAASFAKPPSQDSGTSKTDDKTTETKPDSQPGPAAQPEGRPAQPDGQDGVGGQDGQDGRPRMTPEEMAAMNQKVNDIMAKFTPEELQALSGKLPEDMREKMRLFRKLADMSVDDAVKYLRDNYLNK